jgi:murein DD-endopeptidase MepM/ murein hydrolase activator NlpD
MRFVIALLSCTLAPMLPRLVTPIAGLTPQELHDTFNQGRSGHPHKAIDIMEPRGTPVHAVIAGTIQKLFLSKAGGNTIYEFDNDSRYAYYYAHLEGYLVGLHEGMHVNAGDVIGYVGSTGDASPDAPHLHFTVFELGPEKEWWKGTAINPYAALLQALQK